MSDHAHDHDDGDTHDGDHDDIGLRLADFHHRHHHHKNHLGKVSRKELEDEGEGGLGVDDVVQGDNVCVPQLLQEARLNGVVVKTF